MGASPHMLLNTETAMRDLQRSERRAHHAQLSHHAPSASSDAEMEREAARQAVRSVQKLQSLVSCPIPPPSIRVPLFSRWQRYRCC